MDLSVALVVMPFVIVTDLTGGIWLFGEVFCNIFICMDVMCCTASIMTLCVISVDRYLGITRPLTYPARQSGPLMAKMIAGVWLASASITLPPFCGWARNINAAGVCLISQDVGYTLYSTAVAFYIPMAVMLIMYYKIFRAARKSGAKHRLTTLPPRPAWREPAPPLPPPSPSPSPPDGAVVGMATAVMASGEGVGLQGLRCATTTTGPRPPSSAPAAAAVSAAAVDNTWTAGGLSCLLHHHHHHHGRRSNSSVFRREQKAATTLGVIVGVFSVCWLPFFVLTTVRPFVCSSGEPSCSCGPVWLERTLVWLGYANSLMNPFIYAFFNRDLRSTYWDLLRCRYRNINRRLSAMGVHEALRV
ncbi:5-hydroxytryptamine receptor 7 [Engraulis encrasicolus]|uniref:5-hydroxytryptamine receptor 7 n=1 Tax=Engraulis encrasicolus TaxID=184585 RepID=UPI002FD5075F